MSNKLKLFMGFSVLLVLVSFSQIVLDRYSESASRSFLIIYCGLIGLFNLDKAISRDKVARLVGIVTLALLVIIAFFIK